MQSWLDENLGELITKHGVPAASVAVLADGQVSTAAAGILNLDTGVEATVESVFQIGLLIPEPRRTRFVALDESRLIAAEAERELHEVLAFREPVDGRAAYLFSGGRLTPRSN